MTVNKEVFKFKQFNVDQRGCAMKINTDGVLLAALVNHAEPKKILDIGTGTGVIALMAAQRFPNAYVKAVEIDQQAAETASRNFQLSIFCERLTIYNIAIEYYSDTEQFDLIVSNPPFFVNDLKNTEKRKGIARHADENFFHLLINKSKSMLTEDGKFWLVLPVKQAIEVEKIAYNIGLSVSEKIHIHSDKNKPAFRVILCLSIQKKKLVERDFYIYESMKVNTQSYKDLLKDFFLNF